ncbi:ROK family protein [Mucilaginibacter agri]|uniref:ROK family protein n=1 Tax=Mucilaginibacter agri TaxID=2695265 RepID=A0A965ZM40_9SPHI|nr:ROK family protein [Mucilaginibacter agri]NCD72449.1 ROK family protein [Mucilaginibacter agri]
MSSKKVAFLINNSEIIKCLYYTKVLTSPEVSVLAGKSIPYVIKVLTELKKEGYVEEKGLANSSGGRKPLSYSLNPNSHYILSVAMDQFRAQMVVVDMNNTFISEIFGYEYNINELTPADLTDQITGFIKNTGIATTDIIGVGLTMPGFIDTERGINYTYTNFEGVSIVDSLQESLGIPVFLENDSTAIALAEQKFGIAANEKNLMVLNLGWGIGLGMILNNQIFRGNNGLAGEFSHIPLFKNGKLCNCGKHGCLETEASLIAITASAKNGIEQGLTTSLAKYAEINVDIIMSEALKGDVFSVKLISEAAYHVGEGLAILIHLMNPGAIVLSGRGSVVGKLWLAPIQQAINEHCIPMLTNFTEFKISNLSTKAQLIGGAALVVENFGKTLEDKLNVLGVPILADAG